MIFNENGEILNEEYCLLEYINNNSYLDDLLNESNIWKTIKDTGIKIWNKLLELINRAIDWISKIPSRASIMKNRKKIEDVLSIDTSIGNRFSNEVKLLSSPGYKFGKWVGTFVESVKWLRENHRSGGLINYDEMIKILTKGYSMNVWFGLEETNDRTITTLNLNKEIVNFAISVSELSKPLKEAKKDLNYINDRISFDSTLINILYSYFSTAMSTIRELSNECIKICLNIIKNTGTNYFVEKEPEKYPDWRNSEYKTQNSNKKYIEDMDDILENNPFVKFHTSLNNLNIDLRESIGSKTFRNLYKSLNEKIYHLKLGEVKRIDVYKSDFSELRNLLNNDLIYNKLDQQKKIYADTFLKETDPSIDIYDYNLEKLMECIIGLMTK